MAEKVTIMVLKVDLQCPSCYKKIKRVLCKFPQIRDQVYDQKQNTVTITVICCSPEKIRDKLRCKGGKTIKSIDIKVPEKPKPPAEKPKPPPEKPKEPEKPKPPPEKPKEPEKPKPPPEKPKEPEKPKPPPEKPKEVPKPDPPKQPAPAPITAFPCYVPCYMGHPEGPCYDGYGRPPPPPPSYDFYGRQSCDDYGRPCHGSRCDLYFCEENPSGCTIM